MSDSARAMKIAAVSIFLFLFPAASSEVLQSLLTRKENTRTGLFSNIQGIANIQIFKTLQVHSQFACASSCLEDSKCQSVNFQIKGNPKHLCELSEVAFESRDDLHVEKRPGYVHIHAVKETIHPHPCGKSNCRNGARCVLEDNARHYRCICNTFNVGDNCESWTVDVKSCLDIYTKTNYRKNTAYTYRVDGKLVKIYCHLADDLCGSRGWTLAMKINGSKNTFRYWKSLWSNKKPYGLPAGQTGFDSHETKMPSYWVMPFHSLCVGMKVGNNLNWALIPYTASSLYDVIANQTYRNFTIGREKWMALIGGSSLQANCNEEGFNVAARKHSRLRIGIRANNERDCLTADSWLGFGLYYPAGNMSCGNFCRTGRCGNEKVRINPAFGYILIK